MTWCFTVPPEEGTLRPEWGMWSLPVFLESSLGNPSCCSEISLLSGAALPPAPPPVLCVRGFSPGCPAGCGCLLAAQPRVRECRPPTAALRAFSLPSLGASFQGGTLCRVFWALGSAQRHPVNMGRELWSLLFS